MTTASWVIVDIKTGKAVMETWNKKIADAVDTKKYVVVEVLEYLVGVNAKIKKEKSK